MKIVYPHISLLRPNFVYRNSASTDITITWRKHGWRPQAEIKKQKESK